VVTTPRTTKVYLSTLGALDGMDLGPGMKAAFEASFGVNNKMDVYLNGVSAGTGVSHPWQGESGVPPTQSVTQALRLGGCHAAPTTFAPAHATAAGTSHGVPAHVLTVGTPLGTTGGCMAGESGVPPTQSVTQVLGGAHMGTPISATTP